MQGQEVVLMQGLLGHDPLQKEPAQSLRSTCSSKHKEWQLARMFMMFIDRSLCPKEGLL